MTISRWKRVLHPLLVTLAPRVGTVHPNWLTIGGFVAGALAAIAIAAGGQRPAFTALAAALILLHAFADYLDGFVARATNRETRFGALLDRGLDRIADVLIAAALVISVGANRRQMFAAIVATTVFFIAYYAAERAAARRFEPTISRTDVHLTLFALLLARAGRGFIT